MKGNGVVIEGVMRDTELDDRFSHRTEAERTR